MPGNSDDARQRTLLLPWMYHPQAKTDARKKNPNKREEGHQEFKKRTQHHNHLRITQGEKMQKVASVKGAAQNTEFYDAFSLCVSGLKSTYPN